MWKLAVGAMLVAACAWAQPLPDLRLPKSVHMAGVAVDAEGKPVAEADIDHAGYMWKTHQTDSTGRFTLDTRAPAIVIRTAGFRSVFIRTREATDMRVVLPKLNEGRAFPICTDSPQYVGIRGWSGSFQFPKIRGVKVSSQGNDIDYGAQYYYVKTKHGRKAILHGAGAMWSFGIPSNQDVWRSVKYEEITYDVGRIAIFDARGEFANGNRWRFLGEFGESASYSDVDEATAKLLDQVLDGACMKPVPVKPFPGLSR